eukprot:jgi/Chrzof1/11482/UNPLg00414.t1
MPWHSLSSSVQTHSSVAAGRLTSKFIDLRAGVDHLAGEACAVRHVHAPRTLHSEGTRVQRGMVTKIVKDRLVTAQQHI